MNINQIGAPDGSRTVLYPREYTVYTQLTPWTMGSVLAGGFLIASKDFKTKLFFQSGGIGWTRTEQDTTIPYFVSEATARYYRDIVHSTVPVSNGFTRYWKYRAPLRVVDDVNYSDSDWLSFDEVGGVNMISEQLIVSTCNTASGISLTQRAYAFGDPQFGDFILVEYTFSNTGNIDFDPEIEKPNNQALQTYVALKFKPQPTGLTSRIVDNATGWNASVDDWLDYFVGEFEGEQLRVMYGWDGDAASSNYPPDDEGDPLPASGIFMSPQYPGMAILHVDKSTNDHTNDPSQPLMSHYSYGGANPRQVLSIGGAGVGSEAVYNTLSTSNFFTSFFDWETWNSTQIEIWSVDNNPNREHFKMGTLGFGPYNFNSLGDSVRIVVCYAVGSMGWRKAVEIGERWKNGEISQTEKNIWLRSGRDSLFAKISKVSRVFKSATGDFELSTGADIIEDPPEPPGLILRSAVGGIDMAFSDVGVMRYNVYKRSKTTFLLEDPPTELLKEPFDLRISLNTEELDRTDEGLLKWRDEEVVPGMNYWYAVTAVNEDGVESSKFLNRTEPTISSSTRGSVIPLREAATVLDSVFVVPNPFHVRGVLPANFSRTGINFVGLPAQCRIRIYTQSGDLVATINHELTFPPSDIEQWDLRTNSDQFLASGLYIFVVDQAKDSFGNNLGVSKVDKFVVIR